jgi:pimeloyl-ACP methyl ester carboxylesterase
VLLLSGGNDPVTPPAYASKVASSLPNARHLILRDEGHGQIGAPCMDRVLASFIANADPRGLDARCTLQLRPAPFFLSTAGPAP